MINQEEISGCVACRPGGQAGLLVIGKYKQLPAKTRHKAEMLKVNPSYSRVSPSLCCLSLAWARMKSTLATLRPATQAAKTAQHTQLRSSLAQSDTIIQELNNLALSRAKDRPAPLFLLLLCIHIH